MAASAGVKRKSTSGTAPTLQVKKPKVEERSSKPTQKREFTVPAKKSSKKSKPAEESHELDESDTSEVENGFYGFAAKRESELSSSGEDSGEESDESSESEGKKESPVTKRAKTENGTAETVTGIHTSRVENLNSTSSRESHAKQKVLAKERKAAKPNADQIARSKKLWERLRLKSHVDKEERKKLVDELFDIVTGRVKEFIFKHDSVRVIQCALKYSNMEKRRMIATELKGEFKNLAESRYAKFLIAKLLEKGDAEIQDMIISDFYGHVRRLINHPEAAWIIDDTYRAMANADQKARLLSEWYGPEFAIAGLRNEETVTADLATILEKSPEKRQPILKNLHTLINQIIQKKMTGFTMLHDAMLQYFLACKPGGEESNDFLEFLRPDPTVKEGEELDNVDLLKNLAFTKSGSRLVSLALAYGSAKDRKLFLRPYKDTIEMMIGDQHAHQILLTALASVDDTRLTSKSIFGELFPSSTDASIVHQRILDFSVHLHARTVLLYPFVGDAKWLLTEANTLALAEVYAIRATTSKKDPNIRLQELARAIAPQFLDAIAERAQDIANSSFGYQFMTEVLLGASSADVQKRDPALAAVAKLAEGDPSVSLPSAAGDGSEVIHIGISDHGRKMLKTLVQGGRFDPKTKKVVPVEPPLPFADMFWDTIQEQLLSWSTGSGSFVIVGLVESDVFTKKKEVLKALEMHHQELEKAAGPEKQAEMKGSKRKSKDTKQAGQVKGNAGARILLEKLK